MSYQGWLIKVGNYNIDAKKYIRADSYKTSMKPVDLDSYTDAYGYLHRFVLDHVPSKTEFETPEMLTNADMSALMAGISANYTIPKERKASVTVYVPEYDSYLTQDMYLVDPEFQMYGNYHGVIHYRPVRLCFIAY